MKEQELRAHLQLEQAVSALRAGRLVVFPTETVYGLGADATNERAVASIFLAKGRPADNPLIVHVADLDGAFPVVERIPRTARRLFEVFAPGPLTLVLPARRSLSRVVTAGLDTVAIRVPAHPLALELLRRAQLPVAGPSANRSGEPSPTTAAMARASLASDEIIYLDGGPCSIGLESTVAAVDEDEVVILRPGAVSAEEIGDVAGVPVRRSGEGGETKRSPGTRHRHYRPRATVVVCRADRFDPAALESEILRVDGPVALVGAGESFDRVAAVTREAMLGRGGMHELKAAGDEELARELYRWFVELDREDVATVIVVEPAGEGIAVALRDRIGRASAGRRIGERVTGESI